ncbi:MAG: pantoate--beta-alanine ligase [Deltaproteobacteria bacterium]|nr:pantoate--beta-alanine ligase [Deltaproteobacteria bacterium]MBW2128375.1 pantoate--beta-alanine ligase [Deltaproteobacteria bacterium]MBW2302529.1 pantoate--beta-alanine ligase [Deltaproteobacteria bacterium]
MEVIETVQAMHARAEALRLSGKSIALVPTMGFFHEGHLELMRVGKRHADVLVISIFVNPTQFGPSEDYETYPRDTEGDLAKAESVGVDIVFLPKVEEMYPQGYQTTVSVRDLTRHLCGLSRPGHFDGVTTIVAKLFHATKPHIAIFGQKDYQQLTVVSRMVQDLNMDIKIVGVPTVREPDGLAMSSRNSYLSPEERKSGLCLKKSLDLADELFKKGERKAETIRKEIEKLILSHPHTRIEYVTFCDPTSLEELEILEDESLLALAVRVGNTRLIDNAVIGRS